MHKIGLSLLLVMLCVSLAGAQIAEQRAYRSAVDLYDNGQWDEAKVLFLEFIGSYSGSDYMPEVYFYLAKLESNPDVSIKYFEKILDEYPLSSSAAGALMGLAQYEYAKGDYREAAELYHKVVNEYPQSELGAEASYWSANSHNMAGDIELAEKAFNRTFSDYPTSDKAAWALLDLADFYYKQKDIDAANLKYQLLIQEYPDSEVTSMAYYRYGECLEESGKFQEALIAYKKVLDEHPQSFEAAMVRGRNLDFDEITRPEASLIVSNPETSEAPVREALDVTPEQSPTEREEPVIDNSRAETGQVETIIEETYSNEKYYIQIGAYSNSDNAQLLKSAIEDGDTPVTIVQVDRGGKVLYRVWVGNFRSQAEAELVANRLIAEKGIRNYLIVTE